MVREGLRHQAGALLGIFWTVIVAALLLSGCGKGAEEASPSDSSFKVALLTPGPVNDAGWSALAYRGLQALETDLGAEINNEVVKDAQIRDSMRSYAQDGYDLVIGHGYEYNAPAVEVAGDFPGTVFISTSGGATAANAGSVRFKLEEGFFVAGAVAAMMSETGVVGMIGGPDVPSIKSTFKAFAAGARYVNADVDVKEIFTGKNADVAAAKQATLTAIDQGADVLIHQANAGAAGFFDACEERGVLSMGANSNQNAESPSVAASAIIVATPVFLELGRRVKAGEYTGEVTRMGMDVGAIEFVLNPAHVDRLPEDGATRIEEMQDQIKSGDLSVPMDEF